MHYLSVANASFKNFDRVLLCDKLLEHDKLEIHIFLVWFNIFLFADKGFIGLIYVGHNNTSMAWITFKFLFIPHVRIVCCQCQV